MKTNNTIQNNHIDKNVFLFFIITFFITATVFAYKYFNYIPCEIVKFDMKAKNFRVGEIIRFKDLTTGAIKREWNFGDDSKNRIGKNPFHTYEKPGTYNIKLTVNGTCEGEKQIVIKEKVFILDTTRLATFSIPPSIKVGEILKPTENTKGGQRWEWRFGETAEVNSTKKNPEYVYKSAGLKTITLVVNGDTRYASRKKINVLPKKITPNKTPRKKPRRKEELPRTSINYRPSTEVDQDDQKEEFKAPVISDRAFGKKILAVSKKEASAKDFSAYLCDNLQLPMTARGKRTTFVAFCDKIRGRGIKIKSLEIFRNKKNNCIEYITINYKR